MAKPEDTSSAGGKPGTQADRPHAASGGNGDPKAAGRDALLLKLLPIFQAEAEERLRGIEQSLLELEKASPGEEQDRLVEGVMRDAHSIKGGARTVNLTHVEGICQTFESVTHLMKQHQLPLSPELFDVLHTTVDVIGSLLQSPDSVEESRTERVLAMLTALERGEPILPATPPPPAPVEAPVQPHAPVPTPRVEPRRMPAPQAPAAAAARQQTVRVSIDKLDDLFRQAQEMLAVKLTTTQRVADIHEISLLLQTWHDQWSRVEAEVHRLQAWVESFEIRRENPVAAAAGRVVDFLSWNTSHVKGLENRVRNLARTSDHDRQTLGLMVDTLLADTKKVLMMPFASLLDVLPRMVRDLAREGEKEVALTTSGADIEIDKRILEEMKDPLVHLVRNCIDHGIEGPDERARTGKRAHGTLSVSVAHLGSDKVELTITDDGRGIDTVRLCEAAMKAGMLSAAEVAQLSAEDATQLIFRSGLSTSTALTRISGRGLGMPIVRERVEKLGGRITLETTPGLGTIFRIVLPLTLATLRGILFKVSGRSFVIPTLTVERVVRVRRDAVVASDGGESVRIAGGDVAVVPLERVLGIAARPREEVGELALLLVVAAAGQRMAFAIDEVENEQEVLFKSLGGYLARVPNVAGATVLGSGKVVPILSASDLVHSVMGESIDIEARVAAFSFEREEVKSILLAEDSITSRMLLKEILESAGYQVTTAVDGADALSQLDDRDVDLVVSDVEMPKLNGFELTERIRSHPRHGAVPVILVTGLERQRERERGIDAGASAYIVKSSFDQSALLETIERLL